MVYLKFWKCIVIHCNYCRYCIGAEGEIRNPGREDLRPKSNPEQG